MTLTLRTLLAYLDDTLPPAEAKLLGEKLAKSAEAKELVERIKKVIRKRSLSTPPTTSEGGISDPNMVAAYLSDTLSADKVTGFEQNALESDVHLAEVAACHQILTLVLSEQVRVPPTAYRRMYGLVKGRESIPTRVPGKVIPVGGAMPGDKGADTDDADAQYLLGLPAYSQSRPFGERLLRWVTAAALLAGFVVSAWLVWPKWERVPEKPGEVAKAPPTPVEPEKKPDDAKPAEPEKKPDDAKPMEPEKKPDDTKPAPPPAGDLTPPKTPPREGRIAVAKFDSPDGKVLLARKADADTWAVMAKGGEVSSSDRLVCPPGFTAKLSFETGAVAELWGNVPPDLLPVPVFETAVTPHTPYDGFDADLTLHTGRVYLSAGKAAGGAFRVRFRDEVWDITLPDNASEAVIQVEHRLTPGAVAELPTTGAILHVNKGTVAVKVRYKTIDKIATGEGLRWNSKGGTLDGPMKPGLPVDFSKAPVYPNSKTAQPMQKALSDFADRMKEAMSVSAVLAELRAEPNAPPTAAYFAGVRFSVLASAAADDLGVLADALNDGNRQDIRTTAVAAVQNWLATYPAEEAKFRTLAESKLRLNEEATKTLLRTLRGVTEAERTDGDTLDLLLKQLSAAEVCQREAALYTLLTQVDPAAQMKKELVFDVGGMAEVRDAGVKAWETRIKELKAMK